jgi:hypothetical protein
LTGAYWFLKNLNLIFFRDIARHRATLATISEVLNYITNGFTVQNKLNVPDHDGGRPMEVNACILTTHMVYL